MHNRPTGYTKYGKCVPKKRMYDWMIPDKVSLTQYLTPRDRAASFL